MNQQDNDDFNFSGECHFEGHDYKVKLSINAKEIIHIAKASSSSKDDKTLEHLRNFCEFSEGKFLHQLHDFFANKSEFDPLYYACQRALLDYTSEIHVFKSKTKLSPIVCACSGLTTLELEKIKKNTVFTMESLVKETRAGTGCGACRADLKIIMKSFEDFPKLTAASYIRLWNSLSVNQGEFLCRCKKVPSLEIAELLEKNNQPSSQQLFLKLQATYGIGLSCHDCVHSVQSQLTT